MEIAAVQWNIGGGKLPADGADPQALKSYSVDGLDYIIDILRGLDADVITLQETHASAGHNQAQLIVEALGYKGWVNHELADSHIEDGQRLGQAIICRWSMAHPDLTLFHNPNFQIDLEDGRIETSHDKGRSRAVITLPDGRELTVQTTHIIPFRRSKTALDSPEAKHILADIADKLQVDGPCILQGDFNMDVTLLEPHLPSLFADGFNEVPQESITEIRGNGHRYDHVLYKGLSVLKNATLPDVRTDHYPIVTQFKLSET